MHCMYCIRPLRVEAILLTVLEMNPYEAAQQAQLTLRHGISQGMCCKVMKQRNIRTKKEIGSDSNTVVETVGCAKTAF